MNQGVWALLGGLVAATIILAWRLREQSNKVDRLETEARLATARTGLYVRGLDTLMTGLEGLHGFEAASANVKTQAELAQLIIQVATRLLRTGIGSVMLLDRDHQDIRIVAAQGLPQDVVASTRLKVGEGIAGRVMQDGEPIFVADIEKDLRFTRAANVRYNSRSFICVPMRVKERILGVLNINSRDVQHEFDLRDLRLLSILADQAAVALANLELEQRMHESYVGIVRTLSRAIDAKDSYTHEHGERSARYARLAAESLGVPESLIVFIEHAAMMHDIGKVGIPDALLHKPSRLSDAEFEVMKAHPRIGEKIISPIEFLAPVATMILTHHEHWDGTGYPEGLKGDEIPMGSRIVAIIDAYDAMTSDRPYRQAMPAEKAWAELRKFAGTQFDPSVVDVFIRVLEKERAAGRKIVANEHPEQPEHAHA